MYGPAPPLARGWESLEGSSLDLALGSLGAASVKTVAPKLVAPKAPPSSPPTPSIGNVAVTVIALTLGFFLLFLTRGLDAGSR